MYIIIPSAHPSGECPSVATGIDRTKMLQLLISKCVSPRLKECNSISVTFSYRKLIY